MLKKSSFFIAFPFLMLLLVVLVLSTPSLLGKTVTIETEGTFHKSTTVGNVVSFTLTAQNVAKDQVESSILKRVNDQNYKNNRVAYVIFEKKDTNYVPNKVVSKRPTDDIYIKTTENKMWANFESSNQMEISSFYYQFPWSEKLATDYQNDIPISVKAKIWRGKVKILDVKKL